MGGIFARWRKRWQMRHPQIRRRTRRLGMEAMEPRRLLAGDLGVIEGVAYTDLTDNGVFDVGTDPVLGATFTLYQDTNANGVFDSGTDTQIAQQTVAPPANPTANPTPQSDKFRFEGLGPGTYFVEQSAVSGQLQRSTETIKTVVISSAESEGVATQTIDTLNNTATTPDPLVATPGNTASDSAATAAGEVLGDERDILISNDAGSTANIEVQVDTGTGTLVINNGTGTTGTVVVTYDGVDSDATNLAHNLGGLATPVDLTAGGGTALHFIAGSEAGNTVTIDVFSGSAADFSTITVPLPVTAGGSPTADLFVHFDDFTVGGGTGADFSQVTAIRIQVNLAAASDASFDLVGVVAPTEKISNHANLNPMSLGDLIFADFNDNGLLDSGEPGLAGVQVELYEDTNSNGSFDSGTDAQVGSAVTTDANGNYLFDNLFPGDYFVVIPASELNSGGPLFGYLSSSAGGTYEPAPDPDSTPVDGDDNGTFVAGVGVVTSAITLASGTEPTNDGDADTDSDLSIDFGFVPQIDVAVTKSASPTPTVIAGNQITYTIQVSNNGNAPATNVVVTDDLPNLSPDPLVIDSVTTTGTVVQTGNSSGEIEVTFANLAAGGSETITIVVTVPAGAAAAAAITNGVTVTAQGNDTDLTNNSDSVDVAVDREAVLTLTKSDTPDPAPVGSSITYTLVVTNTGPSTANNVVVSDTLPAGLTFNNVTTTAGSASEAGGVVTANIPLLNPGESATITIDATIDAGFAGTTLSNQATAAADEAAQVTANEDTTVNPQVDLSITKTDDTDPVNRGDQLTYTLQVTNAGPSTATNVEIVDTLPAGVTFVSATGGTVTPPSGGSSDVTINVGNLAAGANAVVTITVAVDQSAANSVENTAIVRSDESTAGFDTDTSNNSVSESTAVQSTSDLTITKVDSADPVIAGNSFTYTITVTNNGPSDAANTVVIDDIPDGIQITSATASAGTVTIPTSAQDTDPTNSDDLTVNLGTVADGDTVTITVNATVLPGTRGDLTNTVSVTSDSIESNSADNSASETTAVNANIDLQVTKADNVDPVVAGQSLIYTIVVTNNGPSTANGVTVTDVLPSGVTFTSVTASQGTASHSGGTITAQLGTLAPNATATVTVNVEVNGDTRGSLTNTATVSADETDTDQTNDSATQVTDVNANVDLEVTKTDSTDPVAASGTLTYTITVTNNGPSTATGVVVNDTLPAGLTFVSGNSTVGTVSNSGNAVTVNVGTLASGASATITINATVNSDATGTLSNTATATAAESDTDSTNNSATQETAIAVPGSISGTVFLDRDNDGVQDADDPGIPGVVITLTGTDLLGNSVNLTTTTDANGNYTFDDLLPGTYTLTETQPGSYGDGQSIVGTGASGTAGTNQISGIELQSGAAAQGFNFSERLSPLSKRRLLASAQPGD
ncbi:MAG: hypothetical protein KatS3mg111_3505 [Pirellulaceae bacterium]|nr:MAG: hypothetical protein KatS3mg111_3505 [Pirellulaceae bacterium]